MPRLACWSCGRQIYTVAPLESLFAEERRCPRCGAFLERRATRGRAARAASAARTRRTTRAAAGRRPSGGSTSGASARRAAGRTGRRRTAG